ncbi:MAG: hypothetical protein Phyf2KO_22610 [Phycisphaerales bacterium]
MQPPGLFDQIANLGRKDAAGPDALEREAHPGRSSWREESERPVIRIPAGGFPRGPERVWVRVSGGDA